MKVSNMLWGIVLVVVGLVFGLKILDIIDINIFFDGWWTLFIIVPCFIDLFKDKNKTGNIIGLVIGISLFLACNQVIDFDLIWKLMVPFVLVVVGLSLIFKDSLGSKIKKEIKKLNEKDSNLKEYYATFGGQNLDFSSEVFTGCSLNSVFGGIKCDLRDAEIKEDTVINASAIFGGISIYVPDGVVVKTNVTPIFGGVSDERGKKTKDGKVTLYINATCMFGGIEIK